MPTNSLRLMSPHDREPPSYRIDPDLRKGRIRFEYWLSARSPFSVEAHREQVHRAAVGVVGRAGDELIVEGQRRRFVDLVGVIGFEDFLFAVVQRAGASQEAEPAIGQKLPMRLR